MGKETSVWETYCSLFCGVCLTSNADTGVTSELSPESESPGYEWGVPIDVYESCFGKPEVVNGSLSPTDESGNSFSLS